MTSNPNSTWKLPASLFLLFAGTSPAIDFLLARFGAELSPDLAVTAHQAVGVGFWMTAAWTFNALLRSLLWEPMSTRPGGHEAPRLLVDLTSLLVYTLATTVIVGSVFHQSLTGFWATSGVVGLVLGFAVRNLILDLFTGIAVNVEQPYRKGDWVEAQLPGESKVGRVVEMNWRTTRLATEDGDMVVIPNGILATLVVMNRGGIAGQMRDEVRLRLDFSVPVARARRILQSAVVEVSEGPGFASECPPVVLVGDIDHRGVEYIVRYWITAWKEISPTTARSIVTSAVIEHMRQAGLAPAREKEELYLAPLPPPPLDRRDDSERAELLARLDLFAELDTTELESLASSLRRVTVRTGEALLRAGEAGDSMFIVAEGVIDVLVPGPDDSSARKVSRMGPGQVVGEMSLLTGEPRSATLQAATDVVAYEITRDPLVALFGTRPEIAVGISEVVARRLAARQAAHAPGPSRAVADSGATAIQLLHRIRAVFRGARD